MATDDESHPSTPVRAVPAEGLSSSPSVLTSPASSSSSPDISAFLAQLRQSQAGEAHRDTIDVQMVKKRKERDEAKALARSVRTDLKKLRNQKARSLKKTKLASSEELLEALANRAAAAAKKAASDAARLERERAV